MTPSQILGLTIAVPLLGILACLLPLRRRTLLRIPVGSIAASSCLVAILGHGVFTEGPQLAFGRYLFADKLSLFHLALVCFVFLTSSVYGLGYFATEKTGHPGSVRIRRYCMLWQGFFAALLVVLLSNHMGLLWVAVEATTLVSAFLILSNRQPSSIEAMWKYLMICSVGILLAFVGTLLLSTAARAGGAEPTQMLWTDLVTKASEFHPRIMLLSFIFVLIGFGTKAGLAPLHTWLPDAHSQAPTPVSAVFSGVMLNCALYAILRYLPLAEAATGHSGDAHHLLLILGLLSIGIAAVFIPVQYDMKRFLAYSSIEHIGIIAVGIGLGGPGVFAALFHIVNHSTSKMLAFFSAGRIGHIFGTRDMRDIRRAVSATPLWGSGFLIAVLSLIGMAPFSIFMSEFQILRAAATGRHYVTLFVFLSGATVIFIAALRHAMDVSWRSTPNTKHTARNAGKDLLVVLALSSIIVVLGLTIPTPLAGWFTDMVRIVENP